MYDWIILLYRRDRYIINQIYFNKKLIDKHKYWKLITF